MKNSSTLNRSTGIVLIPKYLRLMFLLLLVLLSVAHITAQDLPAAEARLRVMNLASDLPPVDVYIDGEQTASLIPYPLVGPYARLSAGDYTLALPPVGEAVEAALLTETVTLEAGHDYTAAIIGEAETETVQLLLLDHQAILAESDSVEGSEPFIYVHESSTGPAIDLYLDGEQEFSDLSFGEYAISYESFNYKDAVQTVAGDPESILAEVRDLSLPNTVSITPVFPSMIAPSSQLPFLDYLSALTDHPVFQFNTLLAAIDAAGLTEELSDMTIGAEITLFAPTDEAFAALPDGVLDALLADPDALRELLRSHITVGSTLVKDVALMPESEITTLTGQTIAVSFTPNEEFARVNGTGITLRAPIQVANGVIIPISIVLLDE
jgi:hypothetical protein